VLVAGDVFDAQGVADKTIHRLFHAMAGFTGPWLMIPATTTPASPNRCGRGLSGCGRFRPTSRCA
jgi:hypothetical protein